MDFRNWKRKKGRERNILWCTNYNRNQVRSTAIACFFSFSLCSPEQNYTRRLFSLHRRPEQSFHRRSKKSLKKLLLFFTRHTSSEPGWSTRTPRHQLHHCFWDVSFTAGRISCTSAAWSRITRARKRHRTKGRQIGEEFHQKNTKKRKTILCACTTEWIRKGKKKKTFLFYFLNRE